MDIKELYVLFDKAIAEGKFNEAEALFLKERDDSIQRNDKAKLEQVLPLLVQLYCSWTPPRIGEAERFALELSLIHI